MYALGNEPIFPNSFNKDDFLFYCKINSEGIDYEIFQRMAFPWQDGVSNNDNDI